jgi:hypothetical protein
MQYSPSQKDPMQFSPTQSRHLRGLDEGKNRLRKKYDKIMLAEECTEGDIDSESTNFIK